MARLALPDAVHLRRMPSVQLGLPVDSLALRALRHNAPGFAQNVVQGVAYCLIHRIRFAVNLASNLPHDGSLTVDRTTHPVQLPPLWKGSISARFPPPWRPPPA